jgi:hypothetical protein
MVNIPTIEPESFIAGDTVKWTRSFTDYKASDGWVLKYNLRGTASINLTATASGDDHLISIAAAATAAYTAGQYKWIATVEKESERYTVDEGYTEIKENYATAASITDEMITLQAQLAAIDAYVATNYKHSSYSIAGRSLTQYSVADLFVLRDRLARQLKSLKDAEKVRRGMNAGGIVRVRFT